jgi:hypothetical protein
MPPAIRWNSLEVRVSGDQFSLTGAYDWTFADGNGHAFNVTGVAVPEPSLAAMAIWVLMATIVNRRQAGCI